MYKGFIAAAVGVLAPLAAAAQGPVTAEAIVAAWQRRQDKVQSLKVEWTERQTYPKGSISKGIPQRWKDKAALEGKPNLFDLFAPAEDTTIEVHATVLLDGAKMRYEHDRQQFSFETKKFELIPYVSTFDGTTAKLFNPQGGLMDHYPVGQIQDIKRNFDTNNLFVKPVIQHFRGIHPQMLMHEAEDLKITGRRVVIDGRACVEIDWVKRRSDTVTNRLWLDPARDFAMARYAILYDGRPAYKIDVRYRADPDVGWAPSEWEVVLFFDDGSVEESVRSTVTAFAINLPLPASEFDVEFPLGSFVDDVPNKTKHVIKYTGQKRVIERNELSGAEGYERWMETDQGEAVPGGPRRRWVPALTWIVVGLGATALLACSLYRRRVRSASGGQSAP